ncbi:DUF7343 domain-containing protein [Natronorarus salvus]|uniref:DUF7343 domain-containing protein n=1 Tax=Natronorarus salvus TaxID=3117733 RepID=UPI002F26AECB
MTGRGRHPRVRALAVLLVGALLVAGTAAGAGIAVAGYGEYPTEPGTTSAIGNVSVAGEAYIPEQYETVREHPGPAYIWHDETLELEVSVTPYGDAREYDLCTTVLDEDDGTVGDLGCENVTTTGDDPSATVDVAVSGWPENATGDHRIVLELRAVGEEEPQGTYYLPVTVIEKEGDYSGDGLSNEEEVMIGTDFTRTDTSGNGLSDFEEVQLGTDPLLADTTGDGFNDGMIANWGLDPTQPYTIHIHLAGLLVLVALTISGSMVLTWRVISERDGATLIRRGKTESEAAPTAPEATEGTRATESADGREPLTEEDTGGERPAATTEIEEPPLTKEERVCEILRENDGRLKQAQLVEYTDWSQATVSRLLSRLEEEGRVTKLRSGRENIVELTEGVDQGPNPGSD